MNRNMIRQVRKAYKDSRSADSMSLIEILMVIAIIGIVWAIVVGNHENDEAARYTDDSTRICAQGYLFVVPSPRASQVAVQVINNHGVGIQCSP